MQILVCIKQVPLTSDVVVDPETGVLRRDTGQTQMNPYDLYALEAALQLKEQSSGDVVVLSMGPLQAETVLREALMMGCDRAVLLTDRAFAGSD
ncbi:MAG: electron transfer flavoprotein subunit beta, partial [Spirochaetia bacterium]|nr:electron transfer flavoprotein subunit beta [Spirochaetia bacterium]